MPSSSSGWNAETLFGSTSTSNPTAEWIARQITEAFPWDEAPRYLVRDRDHAYSTVLTRRLRAMGIRDKHVIALDEGHLRRVLRSYVRYFNESRTHRSLNKDNPIHRAIESLGAIISRPILGGLHHKYGRI